MCEIRPNQELRQSYLKIAPGFALKSGSKKLNFLEIADKRNNQKPVMSEFDSFFKSAFSVDNVIFGFDEGDLKVLLIQRGADPFRGKMALPGDLVFPNEDLDSAAERVLEQLTGLRGVYLELLAQIGHSLVLAYRSKGYPRLEYRCVRAPSAPR